MSTKGALLLWLLCRCRKSARLLRKLRKILSSRTWRASRWLFYSQLKLVTNVAVLSSYLCVFGCVPGWFCGRVPRSRAESHLGVYGPKQPELHWVRPKILSWLCQEREGNKSRTRWRVVLMKIHREELWQTGLPDTQRFNVAVTRAKALLIVVGNPRVLTSDTTWARYVWQGSLNLVPDSKKDIKTKWAPFIAFPFSWLSYAAS